MEIANGTKEQEVDAKRFYFPAVLTILCPECGRTIEKDFAEEPIYYPWLNKDFDVDVYCYEDCEYSAKVKVNLRVVLELADGADMETK